MEDLLPCFIHHHQEKKRFLREFWGSPAISPAIDICSFIALIRASEMRIGSTATTSSSSLPTICSRRSRFTCRTPLISSLFLHQNPHFPLPLKVNPNGFVVKSQSDDLKTTIDAGSGSTSTPYPPVQTCKWNWRGYSVRYQCCGSSGPALVLVHGFGANSDHWRKNISVLGGSHRVYSIDLLGYGYSDKPNPRDFGDSSFYTFETWGAQLNDFCRDVINDKAFFICNSIGGVVGLQAAVMEPEICQGILLLNISLRMLHITKQPPFAKPLIKAFQSLLRNTDLGKLFFRSVATPQSVRNILRQCYHDTSQVTDELVQSILLPGLEPGAVDVFLEFICYSGGPLPEDLLPQVKCPVLIGWGDKDPWEPIDLGRAYGDFESVEDFVVLPDVGHCPQDEAPQLVNPLVKSFVSRHSSSSTSSVPSIAA